MKQSNKKEKSCGVIIYRIFNGRYEYLLIKQKKGHWSIPKGHIESKDNTEVQCAIRELEEETGIKLNEENIDKNFKIKYRYLIEKKAIIKEIVLFTAEVNIKTKVKIYKEEVLEYRWLTEEEIHNLYAYDSLKAGIKKVSNYLNKQKKIA